METREIDFSFDYSLDTDVWRLRQLATEWSMNLQTLRGLAEYYKDDDGEAASPVFAKLFAEFSNKRPDFDSETTRAKFELLTATPGVRSTILHIRDDANWSIMYLGIAETLTARRWSVTRSHLIGRLPAFSMEGIDAICRAIDAEVAVVQQRRNERKTSVISPDSKQERLYIDRHMGEPFGVLDGQPFPLEPDCLTYLDALIKARGKPVSGSSLNIAQVKRVREQLPASVQALITARPGGGSWLTNYGE